MEGPAAARHCHRLGGRHKGGVVVSIGIDNCWLTRGDDFVSGDERARRGHGPGGLRLLGCRVAA